MVLLIDLPIELIFKIFELCDFADLFQIRLVCKQFKVISNQIKIKELVLSSSDQIKSKKWYFTNRSIRNLIKIAANSKLNLLRSPIFDLKNLKRLMIRSSSVDFNEFKIEYLNEFTKLEQLEFYEYNSIDEKKQLNLPQLKVICLHSIYSDLIIDAPKLETVFCKIGLDLIDLKQPDTVRHLEICSFKAKLFTFSKLEKLVLDFTSSAIENILQKLPKLNEIKFNLTDYDVELFDSTIETIRNLLNEKMRLDRKEVKIYFKDRLIADLNGLNNLDPHHYYDDIDSQMTDSDTDNSANYVFYDSFDDYDNFSDDDFLY